MVENKLFFFVLNVTNDPALDEIWYCLGGRYGGREDTAYVCGLRYDKSPAEAKRDRLLLIWRRG